MAIKKSELYSSLWASCDELRGGMDASQYKDYVLAMLFVKYVSDKYTGQRYSAITIPEGASFSDMLLLKGKPDIGDQINKKIIGPLAEANRLGNMPDFADDVKLGSGKEQVERLTNLIAIFENPKLNFASNRADGDDILGDAYEYLMRHFATESGKSKGQFYTPAEVSRIMAQVIGLTPENSTGTTTVYDPTCGSGSLLLKVAEQSGKSISLYGQEKDATTSGLARMNFILHNNPTAKVMQGNTLADPKFRERGSLQQFDYVVANPPFSDKRWSNGVLADADPWGRFEGLGIPPEKNGDFAYLLHILRSMKRSGKGACILPHGVLFRGNAEAEIRRNLVQKGWLKAIIGLPANLFYGTGIPAAILLLDKEGAAARDHIFMVDASKGFEKDGPKNRLRERDLHRVVDVVNQGLELPGFSANVPRTDIEANAWNLNLPRYIASQEEEDKQDIEAHVKGGLPEADVQALDEFWQVFPGLRAALVESERPGYARLKVATTDLRDTIVQHPECVAYAKKLDALFDAWRTEHTAALKALEVLEVDCDPKAVIHQLSEALLAHFRNRPLVDAYAVYQLLMTYWANTMQDDLYLIAADGWKAETYTIWVENKKKKLVDKGWTCDLVPKSLVAARYFPEKVQAIAALDQQLEQLAAQRTELEESEATDDGLLAELEKINAAHVNARLKALKDEQGVEAFKERECLEKLRDLLAKEAKAKKEKKQAETVLDDALRAIYPTLTPAQVKQLAVDDKWMAALEAGVKAEMHQISQHLSQRLHALSARYETPLPQLTQQVADLEAKVKAHLENMGVTW